MAIRNDYSQNRKLYVGNGTEVSVSDGNAIITGNVGIGTTSPSSKLHLATTGSSTLTIQNTTNSGNAALNFRDEGNNDQFQIYYALGSNRSYNLVNGNGLTIYSSQSSSEIARFGNASSGYTDSYFTGNVGIGTTSPTTPLQVAGIAQIVTGSDNAFYGGNYVRVFGDQNYGFRNTGGTYIANISMSGNSYFNGGNVGIGTTSPSSKLNIVSTSQDQDALTVQDDARKIKIGRDSIQVTTLTDDVSTMYLNGGGGSVSIPASSLVIGGTSAGSEKLRIVGNYAKLEGSGSAYTAWFVTNSGTGNAGTYYDAMNGDIAGNDYGYVGQHNSGYMLYNIGSSSPMPYHVFTGGNVGIGTTSPDNKLHVYGGRIVLDNALAAQSAMQFNHAGTEMGVIYRPGGASDQLRFFMTGAGDTMTLNSSGNVGIGTTSPSEKLEVAGNVKIGSTTTGLKLSESGDDFLVQGVDVVGNAWNSIHLQADSLAGLYIEKDTNNVGIGTTSPGAKLQVNGGIRAFGTTGQIDASPDFGAFRFYNGSTFRGGLGMGQWASVGNSTDIVQYLNNVNYYISNGTTALLKVDTNGNVGIGTTSPGAKLDVVGGGQSTSPTLELNSSTSLTFNHVINAFNSNLTTGENQIMVFGKAGSLKNSGYIGYKWIGNNSNENLVTIGHWGSDNLVNIDGVGNVGIGTTSPIYKLTVSGAIEAGGVVTYSKAASGLNTTGYAVAGLTAGFNGASAGFEFKCYGGSGQYQRISYSCWCSGTIWYPRKMIDEGSNVFDVEASANGTTITFTFKTRSGTQGYSPRVIIEATGHSINSTYA